jgi:hypothetical protein
LKDCCYEPPFDELVWRKERAEEEEQENSLMRCSFSICDEVKGAVNSEYTNTG